MNFVQHAVFHNTKKVALHNRSTITESNKTPVALLAYFQHSGFHAAAFTETNRYRDLSALSTGNILALAGAEVELVQADAPERPVRAYGVGKAGQWSAQHELQVDRESGLAGLTAAIAEMKKQGLFCVLAHPYMSALQCSDVQNIVGFDAIEICNTQEEELDRTGTALMFWDSLLRSGRQVLGIAADGRSFYRDAPRAWVVTPDFQEEETLMSHIRAGNFYSTTGPEIYEISQSGNQFVVDCSEVALVSVHSWPQRSGVVLAKPGETIRRAAFVLTGYEQGLRVECRDALGRTAYSNPIYFSL